MQLIEDYDKLTNKLIMEFISKYYNNTKDYFIMWNKSAIAPHSISIENDFWNIADIYIALKNNIPNYILHNWYDYSLEYVSEWAWKAISLFEYNMEQVVPL